MRLLTFAILCALTLILAGIVTVTMTSKQGVDIQFNTQKAEQDFDSIMNDGKQMVDEVEGK